MPRSRRLRAAALGVVALALVAAASASGAHRSAAAPAKTKVLIGWASPVQSNPGLQAAYQAQVAAAKQLGFQTKVLDANLSADKQVSDIDTFINLGAKAIITWTLNPGATDAVLKRARAKGILVATYAAKSPFSNVTVFPAQFFSCNVADQQAAYIAKRIPHAKVLVVGPAPVPDLLTFTKCFETRAAARGLQVLDRRDNVGDTSAAAQPLVEDMLTKHPDAQAIWSFNDPGALGAGAVVKSHGMQVWKEGANKGVIVIGTIGAPEAAAGIKAGVQTATWDQNPTELGATAVEALAVSLKLHKPLSKIPKVIVVKATMYDNSNINKYIPPTQRKVKISFDFSHR